MWLDDTGVGGATFHPGRFIVLLEPIEPLLVFPAHVTESLSPVVVHLLIDLKSQSPEIQIPAISKSMIGLSNQFLIFLSLNLLHKPPVLQLFHYFTGEVRAIFEEYFHFY